VRLGVVVTFSSKDSNVRLTVKLPQEIWPNYNWLLSRKLRFVKLSAQGHVILCFSLVTFKLEVDSKPV